MTHKPFNPYAFPANDSGDPGMSLRDWFAGQALSGYKPRPGASANWHEAIAEEVYQLADAMLAERERERSQAPTKEPTHE